MSIQLGFIGLGEAGYFMAKGLYEEGLHGIRAYDAALDLGGGYLKAVEERAGDAGVALLPSVADVIRQAHFCRGHAAPGPQQPGPRGPQGP